MDLNQYLNPQTIVSLQAGGYMLMLGLMIIEGPIITFIAAFLASLGVFDISLVFFFGWIGDIIGDLLFYSIGRFGWHIFTKKTTVDTPKESSLIKKLDHLIRTNLALAILVIKFTPYAPPVGLTYIGKIRIDIRKYMIYCGILCIPIPLVSGLLGYHIGMINTLLSRYNGTTLLLYLLGAVAIITFAIVLIVVLRRISIQILKQQETTSDKIEKNTKVDTEFDTSIQQK